MHFSTSKYFQSRKHVKKTSFDDRGVLEYIYHHGFAYPPYIINYYRENAFEMYIFVFA